MRRRIITELQLDKIAAVDHPCQEGAIATILKRADVDDTARNPTVRVSKDVMRRIRTLLKVSGVELPPEAGPVEVEPVSEEAEPVSEEVVVRKDSVDVSNRLQGKKDKPDDSGPKTFDDAVALLRLQDKSLNRTEAMRQARKKYPNLHKSYQAEGMAKAAAAAPTPIAKADAVRVFEGLIDRVQKRDSCRRVEAMQRAAREFPRERDAYASAV